MNNSRDSQPDGGVLVIQILDRDAFDDACDRDTTSHTFRVAVVHVTAAEDGGDICVEPGMPARLAAVEAPVVASLSGRIDDRVLELALAADIRVCDEGATFALTQPQRGNLPSDGGTQRLPRILGPSLATDMLLTGRRITAGEALNAGLVTEIVPGGHAVNRANEIATEMCARGRAAGRFSKEAVLRGADMPLDQALRFEADLAILLHTDPERAEGIEAFKTRREPEFQGNKPGE
ncbi:MAG: enoyl-CoA hydratase/isomerase family protein [Chloroflexi bacterium]|nr:enoyl-CoA hydratase/isomerase family protein [Chloroflexota bacterium]